MQYVLDCTDIWSNFVSHTSNGPAIPGTKFEICFLRGVLTCHGGDAKWLMVLKFSCQKCGKIIGVAKETAAIGKTLSNVRS